MTILSNHRHYPDDSSKSKVSQLFKHHDVKIRHTSQSLLFVTVHRLEKL